MSVVPTEQAIPIAASLPGQRTVLVEEDEPTVREMVAEVLAGDGLRVVTAADGRQALESFRAEPPDLVLLDLMLPGLSGMEVGRILRRESPVPMIMLAALDSEATRSWDSRLVRTTT